jgi:hypothetical protein
MHAHGPQCGPDRLRRSRRRHQTGYAPAPVRGRLALTAVMSAGMLAVLCIPFLHRNP